MPDHVSSAPGPSDCADTTAHHILCHATHRQPCHAQSVCQRRGDSAATGTGAVRSHARGCAQCLWYANRHGVADDPAADCPDRLPLGAFAPCRIRSGSRGQPRADRPHHPPHGGAVRHSGTWLYTRLFAVWTSDRHTAVPQPTRRSLYHQPRFSVPVFISGRHTEQYFARA